MLLGSLSIGQSGLNAFSQQLETIGNNVTNLNTPGFKRSQLNFSELFTQGGPGQGDSSQGGGVRISSNSINFATGDDNATGEALDLRINGNSFFVLRNPDGQLVYTKNGSFKYDADNFLVSKDNPKQQVMAFDADGVLKPVNGNNYKVSLPQATTTIKYNDPVRLVSDGMTTLTVYDAGGASHTLTLNYKKTQAIPPATASNFAWDLTIKEGDTLITETPIHLTFDPASGAISGDFSAAITFDYHPYPDGPGQTISIPTTQFYASASATDTTGSGYGSDAAKADGRAFGVVIDKSFDTDGSAVFTFSNGEKVTPAHLAMASFLSTEGVRQVSSGVFATNNGNIVRLGRSGPQNGVFVLNTLEKANVDLTNEFGNMILIQRGFQASSQIVSTASDLIEQLIKMASTR
jgi:flagellar hook protein FlgE